MLVGYHWQECLEETILKGLLFDLTSWDDIMIITLWLKYSDLFLISQLSSPLLEVISVSLANFEPYLLKLFFIRRVELTKIVLFSLHNFLFAFLYVDNLVTMIHFRYFCLNSNYNSAKDTFHLQSSSLDDYCASVLLKVTFQTQMGHFKYKT